MLELGSTQTFWGAGECAMIIETVWNQNQEDVEEQMGRNGDVLRMLCQTKNTVKDTCTEAGIVQESMWKLPPPAAAGAILIPTLLATLLRPSPLLLYQAIIHLAQASSPPTTVPVMSLMVYLQSVFLERTVCAKRNLHSDS